MDVETRIGKLEDMIRNLEKRVSALEGKPIVVPKSIALSEFIRTNKLTGEVNRTLAIGYYLQVYKGLESFNINDLRNGYNAIKVKPPGNINDKINMNIKKGYIEVADEKKGNLAAWYVTGTGCKYVENGFKKQKEA